MRKPGTNQLSLALSCLVGALVVVQNTKTLSGTEFSGGWLTGPLLSIAEIGMVLCLLAFGVAFAHARVAAAIGLASSLLCLPLYLYLIAPIPFTELFRLRHEFKVQAIGGFHLDSWAIMGVLSLGATTYVCLRGIAIPRREQLPQRV
jgi:hypothetical protein